MGGRLRVRVRLFAMLRETAGTRELEVELPPGATVEDAWAAVVTAIPALAPARSALRFAVDGAYADPATPLADGAEVACIPPVSGGGGAPAIRILELRADPLPAGIIDELVARIATDEDGGIAAFLGRTRVTPGTPASGQEAAAAAHAGAAVEELEYEAFEPMALALLGTIADEIAERFGVHRIAIVHRTGRVPLGAVSVAVVAAAPHRDAAFGAARWAIDETKARVPIWKAERFADGRVWVGEPPRDGPRGSAG